jgi:RNA polymerase sigma factor (sigma-70 family)
MTSSAATATMAMRGPSDRWYERSVRRTRGLAPGEERDLTATLDAYRTAVVHDVLGSRLGLRHLRELAASLAARRIDVRGIVELEADARVEDARTDCLARLGRIARLAARRARRPAPDGMTALEEELRALALRRVHVDVIVGHMRAAGRSQVPALARLQRASDAAVRARTRLVESHLRLVTAIARRHTERGLDLPDLVQEGTIGLMRAVERFDPRHGVTFATYAAWWVRQTINRSLIYRARLVRLPGSVEDGLRRVHKHRRNLTVEHGRAPTNAEIAAETQLTAARVADLQRIEHELCRPPLPFEEPSSDDDDRSVADVLADEARPGPEDASIMRGLASCTSRALEMLAPRERRVLELRYGIGWDRAHSLEDIGRQFGLTRQRILQISAKALDKLRSSHHARPLQSFWES